MLSALSPCIQLLLILEYEHVHCVHSHMVLWTVAVQIELQLLMTLFHHIIAESESNH